MEQKASDMLLVLDKALKKIMAVKGISKDGQLQTVEPLEKNKNQFLKIDKQGDPLSNFFNNFASQLDNPTNFSFYRIPLTSLSWARGSLQQHALSESEQSKDFLAMHAIDFTQTNNKKTDKMKTAQNTETSSEYRYQPEQIDWKTMNNIGLGKERLEKLNLLDPLLRGFKTNQLVPLTLNLGTAVTRLEARLSLQKSDNDQVVLAIHGVRKEPQLNSRFFGHEFSQDDKDNLLKTGNMGRVVNLTNPKTGEATPSMISVDRFTNELVSMRVDRLKAPDEIKGVKLSEPQKQTLLEGKPLHLQGMISKKGDPFDATIQFNADKRHVEFIFDRSELRQQLQNTPQNTLQEPPKTFRGKELSDEQYKNFAAGQTVYMDNLIDKKGQNYQGYITLNKDTGRTDFSFQNPEQLKSQAKPVEASKTQTAVNSEGKSNEATKNIKEPLKNAQQTATSEQQKPAKSKGRKM
ncbi:DUF3945 domain-containing protein [Sphingobacterium bambusae]